MLLKATVKDNPNRRGNAFIKKDFILTDLFGQNSWWKVADPEWVGRAHNIAGQPNVREYEFWEFLRDTDPVKIGVERVAGIVTEATRVKMSVPEWADEPTVPHFPRNA